MAEKRALPSKVAAMKARKRQKLDQVTTKPTQPAPKKRNADINSLAWRKVSLPDRMVDVEGLNGGLEELDDVEVIRVGDKVTFHAISDTGSKKSSARCHEAELSDDDGASWSGFDDESSQPTLAEAEIQHPDKTMKAKTKAKSKSKKPIKDAKGGAAPSGLFDALAEDSSSTGADVSAWKPLKLSPDTMAALANMKFSKPTPIQESVIPEVLIGHDVIGKASTGSGKTLAFGVPILERFLEAPTGPDGKRARKTPLALILSPTRELARQLEDHLASLFSGALSKKPWIATLTGGMSMQKQQRLLKDADVVVATPGRLWDIISSGKGVADALKKIDFLVLDEADRLLSEGQFKELEEILNALDRIDDKGEDEAEEEPNTKIAAATNAERQTLVFSATFDRGLGKKLVGKVNRQKNLSGNKESVEYLLSKLNFREEAPKFIDVNPVNQMATGLREGLIECGGTEKDLYLYALLLLNPTSRAIVFTNSIAAVRRITPLLQNLEVNAVGLHSGMAQKARMRSIERFSSISETSKTAPCVLITTDVAERGLDIKNVDLVIHYHLPRKANGYIHRSGRTARAGQVGSSILICAPEEVAGTRRLVAEVHAKAAMGKDTSDAKKQGHFIRTLDIDRRVVSKLKERATLAKKLADAEIAKATHHKEDDFMRKAAEELGVEYDSEEFEKEATGKRGRGGGRKKKEREARELTKAELGSMKAELKGLLRQRVNVGVSEKYLTAGHVNIDELLRQQDAGAGKSGEFLGTVGHLGLEDL